jgi:hypothetical protein
MEARNAAARGPVSEGSLGAAHGSGNRRLRELDWQSLPCVKLPLPSFFSVGPTVSSTVDCDH